MSQIQPNNQVQTYQTGTPLYTYANNTVPQQQTVSVTPQQNVTAPYYQYPQTSIYNDPNKQAASGVNIYIYNPSGMSGPSSNSQANVNYGNVSQPQVPAPSVSTQPQADATTPIANTPINQESTPTEEKKTKKVVELTDDYIKTLESYLHSPDEATRKNAVKEIVQRFEEENSRYDDPALTALLNIALLDPSVNNRMLAMSVISGGSAHGDQNTIKILNNLATSDKMYGQEAKMASSALLKAAQEVKFVPDDSPKEKKEK